MLGKNNQTNSNSPWPNEMYVLPTSFITTLCLSSAPFLATILIIFFVFAILSRLFTYIRRKQKLKQAKDQIMLQSFIELVTYGQTDLADSDNAFERIFDRNQSKFNLRERRKDTKIRFNFKRSVPHLHLPDEDKCPIELVHDVLAKQRNMSNANQIYTTNVNQSINEDHVEIDDEVIQIINDLIRPSEPVPNHRDLNLTMSSDHLDVHSVSSSSRLKRAKSKIDTEDTEAQRPKLDKIDSSNIPRIKIITDVSSTEQNQASKQLTLTEQPKSPKNQLQPPIKIVVQNFDTTLN